MRALTTPHSVSLPRSNHRSGLQKSYNSELSAPGKAKFVESGYHLLVVLFTKIFRQPQETHTSLAPQHYRQHKYAYPNGKFWFPMTNTWQGKRSSSSASTEEHVGLGKLVLSSIPTPSLRWGKHISHSTAKHFELFLKCLTSSTKIAKMGVFGGTKHWATSLIAYSYLLSVLCWWSLTRSRKGVK